MAEQENFDIYRTSASTLSFYCEGAGDLNQYYINPDLSVWKCINDMTNNSAKIGYIDDNSELVLDIKKLFNWYLVNPFFNNKCKSCKFLPICWGGCPLYFSKYNQRTCFYEKDFDIFKLFNLSEA